MSDAINFLKDFCTGAAFAEDVDKDERTINRWMSQPDGLPYTWLGNKRYIHIPTAREWMLSRMRQPNPRRINKSSA
jgi:hypothetical protein